MKKIYLIVLLLVACCVSRAQNELPYFYGFDGDTWTGSGWYSTTNKPSCLNFFMSGQRENSMYFLSFVESCGSDYRCYLMSPRVVNHTEDSVQIRFSYMIPNEQPSTETFVVGYCLADTYTSEEDFVWLEDTVVCTNYTSWQFYQHNLPADVQYIAIAYTSGNRWALMIDDLLLRADSPDVVYSFTVDANEGGEVAVTTGEQTTYGTTTVQEGDALSYTVTANPGCYISALSLDATPNFLAAGQTSFSETLYPVIDDHVLQVTFGHYTYTIQIVAAEHGRIVPDGGDAHQIIAPWDTTVGFRFYPDEGYHISQVALTADGVTTNYYDQLDTFTLANIRKNYIIQVLFALNDYVITTTAGEGGTITPLGEVDVQGLSSPEFTVAANPGYLIDSIFVDEEPLNIPHYSEYIYRFENVVANHTLSATFLHQPYIVHYTYSSHGTATAQGGVTVGLDSIQIYYEDTIIFHFDIEEGYELSDIQLNGVSLGVDNPYALTHVTQNSIFHAVFTEKTFHVMTEVHGSGTITPQQSGQIGYFDTVSFAIVTGYCMQLDSILLDDDIVAMSDTVQLTHIEGDHTLHAFFSQQHYTMDILPCEHGTILGSTDVLCSWTSTLKIVPEHCYRFTHFYLDGTERADLIGVIGDTVRATISSVSADHTAYAEFERIPYNVTVHSTGEGTVTPAVVGRVLCDTTLFFEIIPDECHYVSSLTVNGVSAESFVRRYPCANSGFGDTLRFELEQIEQNYVVEVAFQQYEYALSLTAGEHGSLSTETTLLPCGTDTVITITPDACYEIITVIVDGEDVTNELIYNGTTATYTFANIHTAHSLAATFAMQTYALHVDPVQHGSVIPNNDSIVLCGNDLIYIIIPDECYQIDSVWLDGVAVNAQLESHPNVNRLIGDSAVFVLSSISDDHNLRVSFSPIMYAMRAVAFSSENGSVTFSEPGATIHCGASVTLTMTPNDCYYISEVWHNGNLTTDYQVDENGVGTLSIPNVTEGIYISVFFEKYRYELTLAQETQHGSIDYLPAVRDCGTSVRLSYPAEDCYHLDSVMIGSEWILASDLSMDGDVFVYDIADIRSDLLLDAVFSIDSVHFVSNEGVRLSVTDSVLACGQDLTVYAVREECKRLDSIRLDGILYRVEDIDGSLLRLVGDTLFAQFQNLHEDHNLAVFYSQVPYVLRASVIGGGSISQPAYQVLDCGDSIAVAITPNDCQHFEKVTINDSIYPMDNDTLLVIRNIHLDMNMVFYFSSDMYEVTTGSNEFGEISGIAGQVTCGTDLLYIFKHQECAMLDSAFLDGVCVNDLLVNDPLPTLSLDSISSNHEIYAIFKKIPYRIEIETDSFVFVNREPLNIVDCGDDFILKITPDKCHFISEVMLDGSSVLSQLEEDEEGSALTLPNVQQNHQIEIMFSKHSQQLVTKMVDSEGHLLSMEESTIICGSDTTVEIAPYDDCYIIDSVTVNGTQVAIQDSYLLSDIEEDMVMIAFMHKVKYTVEVHQSGLFVMTEGEYFQGLYCGDTLRLGFAPEEGYYISGLEVDGELFPASDHYVFENLHANHTISVLTELYYYKVVTTTNEWGAAVPDSVVSGYGTDVSIQLIPNDCYKITSVTVDGVNCFDSLQFHEGYSELTIHSLTSDKAVSAEFERIEYACTVFGGEGGSLHPSSATILCGDTLSVDIVPIACYHVDSVWVNGDYIPREQWQLVGDEVHYRVAEVRKDYHVEARFKRNRYSVMVDNQGAGTVVTTADEVLCAGEFSFYIVPAQCTNLQSVLINGVDITAHLTYRDNVNPWLADTACFTVSNVTENKVVTVSYVSDGDRNIDVTFLSGSNILRHETVAVTCGRDTVLPITLECYTLDSVLVDGVRIQTEDSCRFTDVIADHAVQVMLSRTQYQIEAQSSPHGTITPAGTIEVSCGTNKTYSMAPDQGYYISSLLVDNEEVIPASTYVFEDVRANHTIEVIYAQYSYLVDVEIYGNGSVMPNDTTLWFGDAVHFDILPEDCHAVDSVVIDGVNHGPLTAFDFASVTEPHTLYGYFSRMQYSVSEGVSNNGSITLSRDEVLCGEDVSFTVSPNDCYVLDSVLVNGDNRGAVSTDTIHNIRENQQIDAYFSPIFYQVSVDENVEHGTIAASANEVFCGESVTLIIQPESCYSVDSVLVNGENKGDVTSFAISNIRENQSVTASFSINKYTVEVVAGANGTVTNVGANEVSCGESFTITLTPDDCYAIGEVLVDGLTANNQLQANVLTLENITGNHTISVDFEQIHYVQTATCNVGGTVSPTSVSAACGDDETFVITPLNCYHIDTVWLNGAVLPADSLVFNDAVATFTLHNIRQTNEVEVRFEGNNYRFDVENYGNGTVYLTQTSVECEGEATVYILPEQCEQISSVSLNETDITDSLDYHVNVNPLMPDTAFYTISRMDGDKLLQIYYQHLSDNHVAITYTDGTADLYAADSVLACGESITLSMGYDCYTIDSVLVNGENVGAVSSLSLASNLTDQTVRAYFSQNRYTVASEVTLGGDIVLDGSPNVACGDTLTCTIVSYDCYSIDSVIVNGINQGVIMAYSFENIVEDQNIKAYFSRNEYAITVHTEGNGQITLDGTASVLCGESRSCNITPAECASIDSVVVNGVNKGKISTCIFENIIENQEIIAYFSHNEYQFVASAENGGQIEPAGTTTIACGSQQTYSILPDDCYSIDSVVVNGTNVGAVTTCTLSSTDMLGNQAIQAFFSRNAHTVRLEAGEGGNITPLGDTAVLCGNTLEVAITPSECYDIESVMVDGSDVGAVTSYIFENITEDHTIVASFVRKEFVLTPLVSMGGSVTPNVTTTVTCGSDFTFNFEANEGYSISAVIIDVDTIETTLLSYTFEGVMDNHTVKPIFTRNRYEIIATAGAGGSVIPETSIVEYGERQTITIAANDCYHIDSVFADGVYVGTYPTYTFSNVTDHHTLTATFAINEYVISASVEGNGTITPVGDTVVACGENVAYSIVPETGWHISSLIVDENPVEITDGYTFADVRGEHTITAQFAINEYTVTATAGNGGSVTPMISEVTYGSDVTVEITADECYHIDSVFADSVYVGAVTSYTFENVVDNHALTASFAINEYEITASVEGNGTITPIGDTAVACGGNVTYSIVPETGWHISGLLVDNHSVAISDTYTFTNVITNHTITAQFAINEYAVTATAGDGGSVTPMISEVSYGGSTMVEITAEDCYHIDSVFADSVYVGAVASYTFSHIDEDHTLFATFAINTYEITAVQSEHGTIAPLGSTMVNCGEDITYSIVPETGWHISSLIVDENPVEITDGYTFADVRGEHTITALFAINDFEVTATAGAGGHVTPSVAQASYGETITVNIIADDCYHVDSVFVDGDYVGRTSAYTFNNIDSNHTLTATFAISEYTVVVLTTPQHGSITPPNMTTVNCGDSILYTMIPEEGYHVSELIVDGVSVEASDTYLFPDIHANHRISAQFAINEYTITAEAGEGGTISPLYSVVQYRGRQTVTVTPAPCHRVDSVFVDGMYAGASSSYTFNNIVADHTLRAVFAMIEYSITAEVEGNGTITSEGTSVVDCGDSIQYTAVPATGWHLTALVIDGVTIPSIESYTFADVHADHTILAQFAIDEFTVTATAGEGGSVTPTDTVVNYGDSITIEIAAADCYHVDSVFVDGVYEGVVSSYTFRNIAEDHALRATFSMDTYTLTASVEGNGTITPSGTTAVSCGETVTYSVVPATGWHISGLVVDGEPVEVAETYSFTDIRTDHTILAQFAIDEFTVTATAGEGGSVTPTSTVVNYGDSATIEIVAADCHHIDSVFVDGAYEGAVSSYTFRNIAEDHALRATFAMDTYTLTASVEGNGTITPMGDTTVSCGENVTYSMAPATGWHISGLVVDGEPVEVAETYSFTDIRTDHTILAQFAIDEFTVTTTAGEGGTVTPTDTTVAYSESVTVSITAADCYHVDSVFADGTYVGAVESYTFENIADNHTLAATFAQHTYDIQVTVISEENEVFYDTIVNLACGTDTLVGIPLFYCYYVDSISVNGTTEFGSDSILVQNLHEDMDIVFYLSREQFVLVASKQGNGTVTPMDTVHASCDDEVSFTFVPDEGWYVENLIVDGQSIGTPTNDSYTFYNIHENHTIDVIFAPVVFIITSSMDPVDAGNITPYGQTLVNYGEDQTFNISPFPGYHVIDVEVDGVSQGAITTYTFHNVTANHTIVAHLMTVGVDEATVNEEIAVWPNPVENICHIQLPDMRNGEVQLFDVQGKMILRKHVETDMVEIDFVGRPSGMYLIRVVSDGNVIATRKVIRK